MAYKKITEVDSAEKLKNSDSLLVVSDGELKQLPSSKANIGGGKFKTGDVVYRTSDGLFRLISWEDYEANPSAYNPIGLVADPVKRTFVFCELLGEAFATSMDAIKTYLGGYTSFDDGYETLKRVEDVIDSIGGENFPAYYALRTYEHSNNIFYLKNDIFYLKNTTAYVPALNEWSVVYKQLATAFYDDNKVWASYLDRVNAYRKGIDVQGGLYLGYRSAGGLKVYYSELSTVGLSHSMASSTYNDISTYLASGYIRAYTYASEPYCPVFGIYTEEEENA